MIQPKDLRIMYLAGLYRVEEKNGIHFPVFTILTREPSDNIRFIHDRMPVILPKESVRNWVKPGNDPAEIMNEALTDMSFEQVISWQMGNQSFLPEEQEQLHKEGSRQAMDEPTNPWITERDNHEPDDVDIDFLTMLLENEFR